SARSLSSLSRRSGTTAASASPAPWAGLSCATPRARARTPRTTMSAPSASRERTRSDGVDRSFLLPQRPGLPGRVDGEQPSPDRDGDLSGALGAEVQSHRSEDPIARLRPDLRQDLPAALPRTEEADVRNAGVEQAPRPLAVVREGVHLDDGEGARPERQAGGSGLGAARVDARLPPAAPPRPRRPPGGDGGGAGARVPAL